MEGVEVLLADSIVTLSEPEEEDLTFIRVTQEQFDALSATGRPGKPCPFQLWYLNGDDSLPAARLHREPAE